MSERDARQLVLLAQRGSLVLRGAGTAQQISATQDHGDCSAIREHASRGTIIAYKKHQRAIKPRPCAQKLSSPLALLPVLSMCP